MDGVGMGGAGVSEAEAAEGRLYGLMELAEGHRAAVQAALQGLAAERAALRGERERLARQVLDVQLAVQGTVRQAVADSLAGAAVEGVAAVQAATRPLLDRVAGVADSAGQAEAALQRVVGWASWELLWRGVAVTAALAGLLWLAHLSVWWWASWDVSVLQAHKALLGAEIAGLQGKRDELEASRAELERMGVLAKVVRCDPGNRPCVPVDEKAGAFGTGRNYRVIQGY